jgi:Zn-dependent protease
LFKIFGISVELHITFLLFMLLFLVGSLQQFIILLMVFSIVLLHELCHSLVALYYKIKVPKIVLTPIGGLANIELPENPKKEFLISIAGPMSNFVLMFVGVALALLTGVSYDQIVAGFSGDVNLSQPSSILGYFIFINFILGAFNILPGFPMDGGRVFRAVLAFKYDYIKATDIAVKVGRVVALFVILLAFYSQNILMAVIGVFLLFRQDTGRDRGAGHALRL